MVYAFYLSEKEEVSLPASLDIPLTQIAKVKKVSLLGRPDKLKWQYQDNTLRVQLPVRLQKNSGLKQAATFKIEY